MDSNELQEKEKEKGLAQRDERMDQMYCPGRYYCRFYQVISL